MTQQTYYYAVSHGRETGIFHNWKDCAAQVKGFKNAVYKKFELKEEAQAFLDTSNTQTRADRPISRTIVENPNVRDQGAILKRKRGMDYEDRVGPPGKKIDMVGTRVTVVYTDGASSNNGKGYARAGYGVYWGRNDPRNASVRLPGERQTNQRAEASAVIHALESNLDGTDTLEIMTDSQYVINAVTTWSRNWVQKDWKTSAGKEVQNRDLFEKILRLIKTRKGEVKLTYVPGHQGVPGNEEADRLAVAGACKDILSK